MVKDLLNLNVMLEGKMSKFVRINKSLMLLLLIFGVTYTLSFVAKGHADSIKLNLNYEFIGGQSPFEDPSP
jgi:hypothetical protein